MSDAHSIEHPCKSQIGPSDNAAAAVITLARTLKIPVSDWRVRELFRVHPSPSSMLAIAEVLPKIGLAARTVRGSWEHLARIPLPLIAHVRRGGKEGFVVVHEADASHVLLADPARGLRRSDREEFSREASGLWLVCMRSGNLIPPTRLRARFERILGFAHERMAGRWPWVAAAILGTAALAGALTEADGGMPAWARGGMAALSFAGLLVNIALAEAVLDGSSAAGLLGRLCAHSGDFDCGAVMGSDHAKFLGRVPYAFLGVAFYVALLALCVVGSCVPALSHGSWTAATALLGGALPVAGRLILLQARVIRAWCLGCMIGHGLHASAFALAVAGVSELNASALAGAGSWSALALVGTSAASASLLYYLFRAERTVASGARAEWFALTHNPEVLRAVLAGVPASPDLGVAGAWDRGPADAAVRVDFFSAPFCLHCPPAHRALRDLTEKSGAVRFGCRLVTVEPPPNCPEFLDAGRPVTPLEMCIVLHAIGVAAGADAFHAALDEVFGRQEEFRRMRPTEVLVGLQLERGKIACALPAAYERVLADARVAAQHRITQTPTLAANGRVFPAWASLEQQMSAIGAGV